MFVIKAYDAAGKADCFEATRFSIQPNLDVINIKEPGESIWIDLSVRRPDQYQHIYIENEAGNTIASLHEGKIVE